MLLRRLASLKFTLVGMILLAGGAMLSYGNPVDMSVWVLIVPLALLALNLAAAIVTNSRINRQPGLLIFHVCLLSTVLLAGVGRLTHLDSHIEMSQNEAFDKNNLEDVHKGPFHSGDLHGGVFTSTVNV